MEIYLFMCFESEITSVKCLLFVTMCLFYRVEKEKAQAAEQAKVSSVSPAGMLVDFYQS